MGDVDDDQDAEVIVGRLLEELGSELPDDEEVAGAIAQTNASGWGLDTYEIVRVERDDSAIEFDAVVYLTGEQDTDHAYNGDQLDVILRGTVVWGGDGWMLERYVIESITSNAEGSSFFEEDALSRYALDPAKVHRVLVDRGVAHLHHANTVTTACSLLELGGLASRDRVSSANLAQTDQYTDDKDKRYGIWNDIFTDGVDIHARASRRNLYGPVLFRLPVDGLLSLPPGTQVMVMRKNPSNWLSTDQPGDRYFLTIADLAAGYRYGDFGQHVVFRRDDGLLPFPCEPIDVVLDDPQQYAGNGEDLFQAARKRLVAAALRGGVTVPTVKRTCNSPCGCVREYASSASQLIKFF